ncbi:MAG: hypothetical protein P9M03_06425 [Candidatus Theseobacter exili]|nr:hypothetical protein [Candidatus Theseobacter exili]
MKSVRFFAVTMIVSGAIVLSQVAFGDVLITNRTGRVRVITPYGKVSFYSKDKPLPVIPSGSSVEIIHGSMDVALSDGIAQAEAANSIALLSAEDKVTVSVDKKTGLGAYKVIKGNMVIQAVNTSAYLKAGQAVEIKWSEFEGVSEVESTSGDIETITHGVNIVVSEGALVKISTSAITREVHVKVEKGAVAVTAIDGKVAKLTQGEKIALPGSDAVGSK